MSETSPTASSTRTLLALVQRALESTSLELKDNPLLVAVSGGADSLALLHALWSLQSRFGYQLWVAHLDHGLRAGSHQDATFVQEAAHRLGLPAVVERRPVQASPPGQPRSSLEARARQVRYAFLQEAARRVGAGAVATGHTADDQVETVLLHLLRGAALPGLVGMRMVAPWPNPKERDLRLLRPLLEATRQQTEDYCRASELQPRDDPSNRDLRFTRNRLRHRLLPLLEEENPQVRRALWRLARAAARDESFLEEESRRHLQQLAHPRGEGGLKLELSALQALPLPLQSRVLRLAYADVSGSADRLGQQHLEALLELSHGPSGRQRHLPGGIRAWAQGGFVEMGIRQAPKAPPKLGALPVPGVARFGPWELRAAVITLPASIPQDAYRVIVDAAAAGSLLTVRTRRPGDRFQPLGMEQVKKLQDLLVDEKVPRELRNTLPLVEAERGIIWVVGQRIAHWARVTPQTRQVLVLAASRSSPTSEEDANGGGDLTARRRRSA